MFDKTKKKAKRTYYLSGAAMTMGLMSISGGAFAEGNDNDVTFSTISDNITNSIARIPALVSGTSYLLGILLAALGVMKVKDHVENPTQTPLKDGAIRLIAGGALFALPILTEAMVGSVGADGTTAEQGEVRKITTDPFIE